MLAELANLPEPWQYVIRIVLFPVSWIPALQKILFSFVFTGPVSIMVLKIILILFPVILAVVAIWSIMLSVYTVPFRSKRATLIISLAIACWDSLKSFWLYWSGILKFIFLLFGWIWTTLRYMASAIWAAIIQFIFIPFTIVKKASENYFQPGIPWLALLLTIFWCLIEATIFTFTLLPLISEVLSDIAGMETNTIYVAPILYIMLFLLISGSFACMQALVEAFRAKNMKLILEMALVELFVMFLEVLFLYRELVDALAPWLAQQSGDSVQLGLVSTLAIATFAWLGIRSMAWFLFARYGTPILVAIIGRQGMKNGKEGKAPHFEKPKWIEELILGFQKELDWFASKASELADSFVLPPLQVFGASLNFITIVLTGKPIFDMPFTNIKDMEKTIEIIKRMEGGKSKKDKGE